MNGVQIIGFLLIIVTQYSTSASPGCYVIHAALHIIKCKVFLHAEAVIFTYSPAISFCTPFCSAPANSMDLRW